MLANPIPFSLGEMLVYIFIILLLFALAKTFYKVFQGGEIKYLAEFILKFLTLFSCLYFIFIMTWGLNYHRLPFADLAGLEIGPASDHSLEQLCEELIVRTNNLRKEIAEDENGIAYISNGFIDVAKRVHLGYENLKVQYPFLHTKHRPKPKGVLFSEGLSHAGIGGVFFPFTGEANVNTKLPQFMLPSTVAHEIAHHLGFAREDEANFIAYLACTAHPDKDFQYSGSLLALIHTMNAMYRYSPNTYILLMERYSDGVKKDILALNRFWDSYRGPIKDTSTNINNAYLKSNLQKDGIKSYGRMVDLLIAEFENQRS